MISRRNVLGVLAAGSATLLGACGIFSSNYSYRYKIIVEVDTLEGVRSGFAVHEQIVSKSNVDLGDISAKRRIRTRGEAVAVDLPNGRTLFALIPDSQLTQAALDPEWKNDWVESAQRITSGMTPKGPFPLIPRNIDAHSSTSSGQPILVVFRDYNDPGTVEAVDPRNLSASLGSGYVLRHINVQLTNEPVTTGIEGRFKWWEQYRNERLRLSGRKGAVLTHELADNLGTGSFKSGER